MMDTFAIKISIILFFATCFNAFANFGDSSYIASIMNIPPEEIRYDTNKAGMVRVKKTIQNLNYGKNNISSHVEHNREFITTIHDKKGNLMFHKHYIQKNGLIMQAMEDDVVRNVVSGATECDFKIIESSGDTISFHLDPNKRPKRPQQQEDEDIIFFKHLKVPKVPPKNKYDEIIYNRWTIRCVHTIGYEVPVYSLEQENESDIDVENNDDSLSYPLPYKYYLIIALCIIATSVVVMRKKWKVRK